MKEITIEILAGENIRRACETACLKARKETAEVSFNFNGVTITATPDSDPKKLKAYYDAESARQTAEFRASPECAELEAAYEKGKLIQERKLEAAMKKAPESLTLANPAGWEAAKSNNTDPYGSRVFEFAELWARLMEGRLAKGERLEAIADDCSELADTDGITGFMFSASVKLLSQYWKHGEALREWHALKSQPTM